jgi:hypothetical protein
MSQGAMTGSNASRLAPRRVALIGLAVVSILVSPLLVVYEFVVGLVLLIVGTTLRLIRPGSHAGPGAAIYGIALLAGPLVYLLALMLGGFFDW